MTILGIDIGGTKVAVSIGNEQGELLCGERIKMDPENPTAVLASVFEIARKLIDECDQDVDAVGITSPGPMCSRRQMILDAPNLKGWDGFAVGDAAKEALGLPVFMQNDANGAGLAEFYFGGQKDKDLIYLTMSTGIGAGIVTNGNIVDGANDLGGEVGHFTLVPGGRDCACGRKGCWEAYCGGKALGNHIRDLVVETNAATLMTELAGGDQTKISIFEICDAVRAGDEYACKLWDDFIEHMAHAVGLLIQTINPEAIVMGTIAIHDGDLFVPQMIERLGKYAWQGGIDACTIQASVLKNIGELGSIAVGIQGVRSEG